jgi:hypothetical protein
MKTNDTDKIQEFLRAIGPRELTDEEAKQLHILRIRSGKARSSGVIEKLAEEAERQEAARKNPGSGET